MRKMLASLLVLVPILGVAQERIPMPIICAEPNLVEKVLKEHKEEILFVGKDNMQNIENLSINVFLNKNTGTYSIVLVAPENNMICVISSGEKGKLIYNN